MNDKDQLQKLKRYYEKVLIDYYSTNEIDPDMANRIVGGLTRFMNITEQQQQEIEKLTRIAAEADEGCEYWRDKYKQAQAKVERYRHALEHFANFGTNHDTNPTMVMDGNEVFMLLNYIKSMDKYVRCEARKALEGEE